MSVDFLSSPVWIIAFALFSLGCLYLGWTGRPRSVWYSALVAAPLAATSGLGWIAALDVVLVPCSAQFAMSRFRRGQVRPPALLSGCLIWMVLLATDFKAWTATAALLLVLALSRRVAPRFSPRQLLVASSLPSLVLSLYLALGGLTAGRQLAAASESLAMTRDLPSGGRTGSWLNSVAGLTTLAVAIGLGMLWNKWHERRAARREEREEER